MSHLGKQINYAEIENWVVLILVVMDVALGQVFSQTLRNQ